MIQRLARHLILQTRSPYLSRQAILPSTRRTDSLCPSRKAIVIIRTMASDSDYTAFLDKANRQRDAGSGEAHAEQSEESSRQIRTTAVTHGVKVPEVLKKVDAFYVSDSDEPFEPVALKWAGAASKKWPSSDEFAKLISSDSKADVAADSIETFSEKSFDPRKQYGSVIDAVREAVAASDSNTKESDVDVKVYRVEVGHSRAEYWIVALEGAEERIVGLKAKAIES